MEKVLVNAFKCSECDAMFETLRARNRHENEHIEATVSSADPLLSCHLCDYGFSSEKQFNKHNIIFHSPADLAPANTPPNHSSRGRVGIIESELTRKRQSNAIYEDDSGMHFMKVPKIEEPEFTETCDDLDIGPTVKMEMLEDSEGESVQETNFGDSSNFEQLDAFHLGNLLKEASTATDVNKKLDEILAAIKENTLELIKLNETNRNILKTHYEKSKNLHSASISMDYFPIKTRQELLNVENILKGRDFEKKFAIESSIYACPPTDKDGVRVWNRLFSNKLTFHYNMEGTKDLKFSLVQDAPNLMRCIETTWETFFRPEDTDTDKNVKLSVPKHVRKLIMLAIQNGKARYRMATLQNPQLREKPDW